MRNDAKNLPDDIKKIIQQIVLNAATDKQLNFLHEFLGSFSITNEKFANYLVNLSLEVLSSQFKDFLVSLQEKHSGIHKVLLNLCDQNNPQSLFYVAEFKFKKTNNSKDPSGLSYLKRASVLKHKGARCALQRIGNGPNQTKPLRLQNKQMLKENIAQGDIIKNLREELSAARIQIQELQAQLGIDPHHQALKQDSPETQQIIEKIIQQIIVNVATDEELKSLDKLLGSPSITNEMLAEYLVKLSLHVLSNQFKDFLVSLQEKHSGVHQFLLSLCDQNNEQSLFYVAEFNFKKTGNSKDPSGLSYLRRASEMKHYGATCALMEIEDAPNQTELLLLQNNQMLRENIAQENIIKDLREEILAAQKQIQELQAQLGIDPYHQALKLDSPAIQPINDEDEMLEAQEDSAPKESSADKKEESLTRRETFGHLSLSLAQSLWKDPMENLSAPLGSSDTTPSSTKRLKSGSNSE